MLGLYHIDKTQTGSESNPSYSLYEISGIGFSSKAVRVKIIKIVLFKVRNEAQAVYYSDVGISACYRSYLFAEGIKDRKSFQVITPPYGRNAKDWLFRAIYASKGLIVFFNCFRAVAILVCTLSHYDLVRIVPGHLHE